MLQSMRRLTQNTVFKGLMILLVVSFAAWGIGDIFRGNPLQRTVAKVGKIGISVQALNQEFDVALNQARQSVGPGLSAQQAKQMGIFDAALEGMIDRTTVDQDIQRLGINVGQKTVLEQLADQPRLRDKDGKFNRELFQQILNQARMTEREFIDQMQLDIGRSQLLATLKANEKTPKAVVDAVYKAQGQKRIYDVVTLKNDSINDIPAPDEKLLRAFYDENPTLFTAPEYRTLTIATLSGEDVVKDISVSDEQVQAEYDAKSEQLTLPERRDIVQTVLQDEDKAKKLSADAKAKGDLVTAAKKADYSAVPIGQTEKNKIIPELSEPVFAMKAGEISEPIKSSLGWHVVQMKKIWPAGKPELKDIKNQLRETMRQSQAVESVTRMVNQLDDELAGGNALEDIADSLKLRLIKVPAVDSEAKTIEGREPAELPYKDYVLKTAFAQNSGETSPVVDDKKGNYFVVRTDDITPGTIKPFDGVKDQIAQAWKTREQAKRATVESENIAKALREGKLPASFAARHGIDVRVSKPVSMLGYKDDALPSSLLPQMLKMKKGDVITSAHGDKQIVLKLTELVAADETDVAARNKTMAGLNQQMPAELLEEYLKYLRILFPVKIHQDILEHVRQQGNS